MHVSSQYDTAGKGSAQSCSCCQWSPVCRDFLPSVHPGGLLSARGAGGDPARPPLSHLWFLLNQKNTLLPGCRKSWAHTAAYMAWFLKSRKREVRFSLAPCPIPKCRRAGSPTLRKLPPWAPHVLCLEGGPDGSPPAEYLGRESQDPLPFPADSAVMGSPLSLPLCRGWGELEAKNSSETLRVEAAGSFPVSHSPWRVCSKRREVKGLRLPLPKVFILPMAHPQHTHIHAHIHIQ